MSRRKRKTNRWLERRRSDGFATQARQRGYRTRAVFKLEEIDRRDRLIRRGMTVLELGAAPGGWTQYIADRVGPDGRVIAVDMLPMKTAGDATIVQGDLTEVGTQQRLIDLLGGNTDLVLSDMAPNITGIAAADQAHFFGLLSVTLDLGERVLRPGGCMLMKVFEGPRVKEFRERCRREFANVQVRKPSASRSRSREYYLLATGFRRSATAVADVGH